MGTVAIDSISQALPSDEVAQAGVSVVYGISQAHGCQVA